MSNIDKQQFLKFCHNLYDELHGEKKINEIFDIKQDHLINLLVLYRSNFIWRETKIFHYLKNNTNIKDSVASLFYVNAFQHYLQKDRNIYTN